MIPRPETEYLIELLGKHKKLGRVLDVGTGSGVIALSLMGEGLADSVLASDLSPEALKVARINSSRLRIPCKFLLSDRLKDVPDTFDTIVSNPPYIKESTHRKGVHDSVDTHEPHLALYLKDAEYTQWFSNFFAQVFEHLNPGGLFMMEGHENEVHEQAEQLKAAGFTDVVVLNDLSQVSRFISGRKVQ